MQLRKFPIWVGPTVDYQSTWKLRSILQCAVECILLSLYAWTFILALEGCMDLVVVVVVDVVDDAVVSVASVVVVTDSSNSRR